MKVLYPLICIASGTYYGRISRQLYNSEYIYFRSSHLVIGCVSIGAGDMDGDFGELGQGCISGVG